MREGIVIRMESTGQKMLTRSALAERWETSPGRLANMASAGIGPHYVKIGASVRYRLRDIEAYEDANTVAPMVA